MRHECNIERPPLPRGGPFHVSRTGTLGGENSACRKGQEFVPREIYSAIEDQVGAVALLFAGSDRENHPSHKKYASGAALKAQRPVKSLIAF